MDASGDHAPNFGTEFDHSTRPADIAGAVATIALLSLLVCILSLMLGASLVPKPIWIASAVLNIGLIGAAMTCRQLQRRRTFFTAAQLRRRFTGK